MRWAGFRGQGPCRGGSSLQCGGKHQDSAWGRQGAQGTWPTLGLSPQAGYRSLGLACRRLRLWDNRSTYLLAACWGGRVQMSAVVVACAIAAGGGLGTAWGRVLGAGGHGLQS